MEFNNSFLMQYGNIAAQGNGYNNTVVFPVSFTTNVTIVITCISTSSSSSSDRYEAIQKYSLVDFNTLTWTHTAKHWIAIGY